jgi:hypothetical protein
MDATVPAVERPKQGDEVLLVGYRHAIPFMCPAVIVNENPFLVRVEGTPNLEDVRRIVVVVQDPDRACRSDATLIGSTGPEGSLSVELALDGWNNEDRRRCPRVAVDYPITLESITESEKGVLFETHVGQLKNLSLVGGLIAADWRPEPTSLLRWRFVAAGNILRGLGLVARSDANDQTFGLEFVDYVGDGRAQLATLLDAALSTD